MNRSLYFSASPAWGSTCGRGMGWGCRGGHLSSLCGCAPVWSRAELPLWAKNTSGMRGQGREKERWRHEERKKNDWGRGLWRDAEMARECSHAECTVLCSPFPSSRHHPEHEHFFNHSRESRAELSGGCVSHCSVCSIASSPHPPTPPLPCHTAPCLQLSTYPQCSLFPHPFFQLFSPYPSPALFSYPHLCSISPPFHLTLSPSFVLHVCVTVSFVSFPSLHLRPSLPAFSACTGWMETFCLLQRILFLPYWPTNRKESQAEMSLGCLFFWLPAMSACQARVCVCVLVWVCVHMCVWVHMCECVAHGLLSSQTEGLLWHVTQLYHTGGQNHLIRSTLTQIWIPNMDSSVLF